MEVEEIQTQGSKFPRIGRGGCNLNKLAGQNGEEENDSNRVSLGTSDFAPDGTSRIVRVSRASGGQDLHSKVGTSKGLRDRRVRLSVHTAMQFYDLQDRLGYDRPSKAVEWLLKAAAKSIDELPSINTSFPNAPNQLSDEMGSAEVDPVESAQLNGCNSETSKGSTGQLLLSRTENQIKANEWRAKREEKQNETCIPLSNHLGEAPLSQSSFTELLMGSGEGANLFHEQRQWGSDPPMDYFPMAQYHSQIYNHNHHHQQQLQQFPLLSDQLMPTVAAADLNFTMSSSSVATTDQAKVALEMVSENRNRFDIIISAVHMPDMNCFKLLDLVGLEMGPPAIMLLANSDPKLVMKGITHGACDYLVKPVRQEELKNIWQRSEPKQQNLSNSQDTDQQANGEIANGTYPNGSSDQNGKRPDQKRKDEEEAEQEGEDNGTDNDETCSQKKPRVVWSVELHRKFVAAVYQLGINKAVPKKILELMNVEGITMENMASHLQKYRLYLKRISSTTEEEKITSGLRRKDPYMQRNSFDGVGDSRELPSKGIFSNSAMSPYQTGLILDGLNTPSGVSLLGFSSSSPLIQANNRSQSISNSFSTLSKLNLVVSQPNQHLGQEKRYVLKKTDLFPNNKENTSSQANFRQSVVENSVMDSKMRSNEYHLLEQMESQKSFESLDDFMNKQEHGGTWKEAFFHIFGRCGAKYGKDSTYDEAKFAFLANYYLRSQLGSKDKVLPKKDFFEEGGKGVLMQKINEAKRSNASCFMFGVAFTIFAFMLLKLI